MCGVVGIYSTRPVNLEIYDALTMLQHRGQDAAGMVTCHLGRFNQQKGNGMVRDVFGSRDMQRLEGNVGIGHVRYPTAGSSSPALAQPFYVNSPYGIALAHNGNLTNTKALSEQVFEADLRHFNTDSDSEVLLNVLAHELQVLGELKPTPETIFKAIAGVYRRARGAYACVAMIANQGIIAFRDPYGIRPLVYGKRTNAEGTTEYMVASESVSLDVLGFELVRDVSPGEAIIIDSEGQLHSQICSDSATLTPCIFEHVYFARPDSMMDGVSVYKSRMRMGEKLAEKIMRERPDHDIDVVIPIPDTSRVSGQILAHNLNVKFREGLMKNRYIGRTFIMPGQSQRKKSVRQKLNPVPLEFKGKNVLLVDDSIVRGTTSQQIIQTAREAGAAKVYLASAAPAVRYPNVYGIDMPSADELIAHGRTDQEVQELLGCDWLIYQDIDDLVESVTNKNAKPVGWDCSVFTGEYVTQDIDAEYLAAIDEARNDSAKSEIDLSGEQVVGIRNGDLG